MAIVTLGTQPIVPSQVFGFETSSKGGYDRESFTITVPAGKTVRVGTILKLDYATKTATIAAAPADAVAVTALGDVGVFVGRDLGTNPATAQDFENLTMTATGVGVVIVKGDGSTLLKRGYLDFDGTKYYSLTAPAKTALDGVFTKVNRFKVIDQQYTA